MCVFMAAVVGNYARVHSLSDTVQNCRNFVFTDGSVVRHVKDHNQSRFRCQVHDLDDRNESEALLVSWTRLHSRLGFHLFASRFKCKKIKKINYNKLRFQRHTLVLYNLGSNIT